MKKRCKNCKGCKLYKLTGKDHSKDCKYYSEKVEVAHDERS